LGLMAEVLAATALAVWLYLAFARGGFWRCSERDDWPPASLAQRAAQRPSVAAVVPARNEADQVGASIGSLLQQDYAGPWTVILVDDESSDGTADVARRALAEPGDERLRVVTGGALPAGWTGKLWAIKQGIEHASTLPQRPDYLLLTDADIVHPSDCVRRLVEHAQAKGLVLTSLMVKLRCESLAERTSIPAFVFFFQMLYPFPWVNRPHNQVAAAAGGCMLVRADALAKAGGIEVIRDALIDDCALARVLKRYGPIWLGLSTRVRSLRPYAAFADIRRMVARSAYAQLRYSPLLLLGTVAGMGVTYLVPPVIALFGTGVARVLAAAAWGLMAFTFLPTLRLYRRSPLWGIVLPAIALQYLIFTLDSAYQYMRGRGGTWKGRVQAGVQANVQANVQASASELP
jgi:hopene-associated glycosyltransferase HpnB